MKSSDYDSDNIDSAIIKLAKDNYYKEGNIEVPLIIIKILKEVWFSNNIGHD